MRFRQIRSRLDVLLGQARRLAITPDRLRLAWQRFRERGEVPTDLDCRKHIELLRAAEQELIELHKLPEENPMTRQGP